jgi:hypothetical protein
MGLGADAAGNLYFTERAGSYHSGADQPNVGEPALNAVLGPSSVAVDAAGNLYIADGITRSIWIVRTLWRRAQVIRYSSPRRRSIQDPLHEDSEIRKVTVSLSDRRPVHRLIQ